MRALPSAYMTSMPSPEVKAIRESGAAAAAGAPATSMSSESAKTPRTGRAYCSRRAPAPLARLCHVLPEAQPFALVADARLEHEPGSLGPLAGALVQLLVLRQRLAVNPELHLRDRLRVGPEEELEQADVA